MNLKKICLIKVNISNCDIHITPFKLLINQTHHLRIPRIGHQVLILEDMVLVPLVLVLSIEVGAVEVKQTVTQLVAGYGLHLQVNCVMLFVLQ